MYFTEETEDAIVKFNNTECQEERDQIYREKLEYPFDKMAESIINRFKFPYINNSFEETKSQVISFLVLNLHRYTKEKGKAFSYFSVITKNYLILYNTNAYKHQKRSLYMSDEDATIPLEETLEIERRDSEEIEDQKEFMDLMVSYWEDNINSMFKKEKDIKIANAILELFRRAEYIENYNKKALYLNIREMTDCKTARITKVIKKMKQHFYEQQVNYRDEGVVK